MGIWKNRLGKTVFSEIVEILGGVLSSNYVSNLEGIYKNDLHRMRVMTIFPKLGISLLFVRRSSDTLGEERHHFE